MFSHLPSNCNHLVTYVSLEVFLRYLLGVDNKTGFKILCLIFPTTVITVFYLENKVRSSLRWIFISSLKKKINK